MSHRGRASVASRILNAVPAPLMGNSFEVFTAALCLVSGLPTLLAGPTPTSLEALLPPVLVRVWGGELVIGGALIVAGVLTNRHRLERAGLVQLGPASLAYGIALLVALKLAAAVAAGLTVALALTCAARWLVLFAADRMRQELLDVAASWEKFPPEDA